MAPQQVMGLVREDQQYGTTRYNTQENYIFVCQPFLKTTELKCIHDPQRGHHSHGRYLYFIEEKLSRHAHS